MPTEEFDYLIVGAGILGLRIASSLRDRYPGASIAILEKEKAEAMHASGRNSGVLHAGFYYAADSLKAKFTRDGNQFWKRYAKENKLSLNESRKLVVAKNKEEEVGVRELYERGKRNGVNVEIISSEEMKKVEPLAKTSDIALYSPETATINPTEISNFLRRDLERKKVVFYFSTKMKGRAKKGEIYTNKGVFKYKILINAAGAYADQIAQEFNLGKDYILIPFKGLYAKYSGFSFPLKVNIYPVPDLRNPFLGVHFTVTVDNVVKIGPTAIPAFGRENYGIIRGSELSEAVKILYYEAKLFFANSFGFRELAFTEMKKYNRKKFIALADDLVYNLDKSGFTQWSKPGIRAQLLNKKNNKLEQDFIVESDQESVHILNSVSPAFTSAPVFADWVVEKYVKK